MLGHTEFPNQISVYYHKNNLRKIKDALGKKCTFISHVRLPNDKYEVHVKFRGNKKPIVAQLNGTPFDIEAENYMQLKNDLINEARKRGLL